MLLQVVELSLVHMTSELWIGWKQQYRWAQWRGSAFCGATSLLNCLMRTLLNEKKGSSFPTVMIWQYLRLALLFHHKFYFLVAHSSLALSACCRASGSAISIISAPWFRTEYCPVYHLSWYIFHSGCLLSITSAGTITWSWGSSSPVAGKQNRVILAWC